MSATRKYVPCAGSTLNPTSVSCSSKNCLFRCKDAPRPLHAISAHLDVSQMSHTCKVWQSMTL